MNVLEVESLTVRVGSRVVLDDINLRLKSQETHLPFGPNRSGKTNLINAAMGTLSPPDEMVSGRVVFSGEDITGRPAKPSLINMVREIRFV